MTDRAHLPIITEFIELLAQRSDAFASMAGVGGMETAGHLISYLDENPKDLEPWLNGGFSELPDNWIERGSLTHHALNGKIVHPRQARHARIIKSLKEPRS
ncbi:hypothetical protein [Novosphingobium sp. MBES04]|uniref:hypothetical protein n=1 Tax=Novosphingobium sp. MBES04 TaxID=1206458 RepID=UPI00057DEB0B|nr:hypothetical protein [Novosphingobium sp. MBES04]GAM06311.1 hypothetical conserved protein [Novosphingobium sp. MBES04]